jgi:hypothetical protein
MKDEGREVENKGKQERSIHTTHGIITFIRTVLKPSKKLGDKQQGSPIRGRFNPQR